jgi:hypothetical protein
MERLSTDGGNYIPADQGFQGFEIADSDCSHDGGDNAQRPHSQKNVIGPPKRHAEELLRDLFSEKRQERCEISTEIVEKVFAIEIRRGRSVD